MPTLRLPKQHANGRAAFRLTPLVALIAALFAPTAYADSFTITNGQTDSAPKTLLSYETGVIQSGGTLDTGTFTSVFMVGNNASFTNNGLASSSGNGMDGIVAIGDGHAITNNGTITTTGSPSNALFSQGNNITITNNGTISTTGDNGNGIYDANASTHTTIVNRGTISTTGDAAFAISSSGSDTAIANSGNISTSGVGGFGIFSSGSAAQITNSGLILTIGSHADGIQSSGATVTITHSGNITVTGSGSIGMSVSSAGTNTINLSGSITANGNATQAIASGGGDETLNLYPGTRIIGTVNLGGGTNTVNLIANGAGPSATMSISNPGTINTTSGNALSFVNGNTVHFVDTTNLTASQASLGTLSANVFQNINQQLNRTPALHRPAQVASVGSDAGLWAGDTQPVGWGQVFGKYSKHGSDGAALAFEDRTYGVIGGYEQRVGEHRAGIFGGVAQSNIDTSSSSASTDSNGIFAGVYGQYALDQWRINGALALGYTNTNSDRRVTDNLYGVETASADYHGWYISPSVSVMRIMDQGAGLSWRPSVELNYTYGRMGSYDESGTTRSNLSVGSRTASVLNTRVQLAAHQNLADKKGEYEWRGGVSHTRYGDDATTISLQGVGSSRYAMTGTGNVTGAYAGVNGRYHYKNNLDLVGDIELFQSSDSDHAVMAYAGLEYRF